MNTNFPCKYGHSYEDHYLKEKACWFCAIISEWCDEFVGDNLRFLEGKKFKENHNGK